MLYRFQREEKEQMCCIKRTINNCNVKILFSDDSDGWQENVMLEALLSVYDDNSKAVNEVDNNKDG